MDCEQGGRPDGAGKAIVVGGRTFRALFPDLLRPLTADERADLKAQVGAGGVKVPVIVDEHDGVIDGLNRLAVAGELGLAEVPVQVERGLTLEQKRQLCLGLHTARRNLSPEEQQRHRRERAARVADKRREGKSLRVIASEEGVSLGQVQRDLSQAAGVSGDTPEPAGGTVRGADGKCYPAGRPPALWDTPEPAAPSPSAAPEPTPHARPAPGLPPKPSRPAPRYPHSDLLIRWIKTVSDQTLRIEVEWGGIKGLLAEPEKWDLRETKEVILPMLVALRSTIDTFRQAIRSRGGEG